MTTSRILPSICGGLETEALIDGKLVVIPKHDEAIEFYGLIEEAEAHLGRARILLKEKGYTDLSERAELLQRAVLLTGGVFAGYIDYGVVIDVIEQASRGLEAPPGWSITGCSIEEAEVALASVKLRHAERIVSRMAGSYLSRPTAETVARILSGISYTAFLLRYEICKRTGASQVVREKLVELAVK